MPSVVSDGLIGLAFPLLSHTGVTYLEHLQRTLDFHTSYHPF